MPHRPDRAWRAPPFPYPSPRSRSTVRPPPAIKSHPEPFEPLTPLPLHSPHSPLTRHHLSAPPRGREPCCYPSRPWRPSSSCSPVRGRHSSTATLPFFFLPASLPLILLPHRRSPSPLFPVLRINPRSSPARRPSRGRHGTVAVNRDLPSTRKSAHPLPRALHHAAVDSIASRAPQVTSRAASVV